MTLISDIDENGINNNLKIRYSRDQIYVSFLPKKIALNVAMSQILYENIKRKNCEILKWML